MTPLKIYGNVAAGSLKLVKSRFLEMVKRNWVSQLGALERVTVPEVLAKVNSAQLPFRGLTKFCGRSAVTRVTTRVLY